jgi:serine/threonine protein kinase
MAMPWWLLLFVLIGVGALACVAAVVLTFVFLFHRRKNPVILAANDRCPRCGGRLPKESLDGLCPRCLVEAGMQEVSDAQRSKGESSPTPAPSASTGPYRFSAPDVAAMARRFPQLEVLEFLGQGGMGAVYKARQTGLDRLVALKILPPDSSRDPAFAERFTREARALAKLNHPNIVMVHDFGQAGDFYFFVMEFVDGVNLRQTLRSEKLRPKQALTIIPHICDALQYAHEEGVVHRDIKPENILLDKRGRVKIADFGLAKIVGHVTDYRLTGSHQIMGTPLYMAPEQVEKPQAVDHRADIYSLGVVFYEMLTGQLPMGHFPPPSQKASVDARLDQVVLRAMEHEPDRRYQQANEVKTDVEAIRHSPPHQYPPPPPSVSPPSLGGQEEGRVSTSHEPDFSLAPVRERLRGPGAGLLAAGVAGLLASLALILWAIWGLARHDSSPGQPQTSQLGGMNFTVTRHPESQPSLALLWALLVFQIPAGGTSTVVLLAGISMRKLEFYKLSLTGCVLAMVPLSLGWLVSLPLGLWAFVNLRREQVRSAFDRPMQIGKEKTAVAGWLKLELTTLAGWGMLISLLGAINTFLPWARTTIFGIGTTLAGFDSWQGLVAGSVFLAALLVLIFMDLIRPAALLQGIVMILAGLAAAVPAGIHLWNVYRPAQPEFSMSGDVQALGGLVKSMMEQMLQGIQFETRPGPYITVGLGAALFLLGLVQLRRLAATRRRAEVRPTTAVQAT